MKTAANEPTVPDSPVRLLLLGAWFALLTSLLELTALGHQKLVKHQHVYEGVDVTWMVLLSYLLVFTLTAAPFAILAWRWPRPVWMRVASTVLSALLFFSLLLGWPVVNRYAALILAIGLGTEVGRQMTRHQAGVFWLVRGTTGALAAVALVVALVPATWRWYGEQQTLARLPAPRSGAPNVLLVTLDTVRAHNLSAYGYDRVTTPNLERLAREGVRFDWALAPAPWTLPTHASLFTGHLPHEMSADWMTPLDGAFPTLAEAFDANGYVTGGFIANIWHCTYESGLNRGFAHYEDHPRSLGQFGISAKLCRVMVNNPGCRRLLGQNDLYHRKSAGDVNQGFLAWLDQHRDRPFFAFLNYFDAHYPYLPPEPFDGKFGPRRREKYPGRLPGQAMLGAGFKMPKEEVQVELDAYDGAIAYMDHELGRLFAELRQRGALDNTLVIITSDHGEQFGEGGHRLFSHANSLYMSSLHVPLVMSFPGRLPEGKTVAQAVSLRDVPSTIIGLVSLDSPPAFPGRSLTRFWDETAAAGEPPAEPQLSEVGTRQGGNCSCQDPNCGPLLAEVNPCLTLPFPAWYPSCHGPMQSLVEGRLHYIRNGGGREELYDYKKDPFEEHNLVEAPECHAALERFRNCLRVILP